MRFSLLAAVGVLTITCAPGCLRGLTLDEVSGFEHIGSRQWMTTTFFAAGVQHDSHVFVVSSRGDYCERVKVFRAERAPAADEYRGWVGSSVGWDVERRGVPLGEGEVTVKDDAALRAAWFDRTMSYLEEAGALWDSEFEGTADVAFLQFHRGSLYRSGDGAEHDSPLGAAADGEGEIALGNLPIEAAAGNWQWSGVIAIDAGNPYEATRAALETQGAEGFTGLTDAWAPRASGEWFDATGGVAQLTRDSVHSFNLDLEDGVLLDASGAAAGGFRMWGNYGRCFVDHGELEPVGATDG